MRRADVTAVENQRILAALRALPRGTVAPHSVKRVSDCEVHYNSPRPNCILSRHAPRADSLEHP